jgi:LacI family transcriptional regulator
MTTIYDVAARAGVSPATVSRVFNGTTVSPERVAAVRAAAAELGFVPNRNARRLRTQSSEIVAMLVPDVENPFFTTMVRAVTDVARAAGLWVMLCNTDDEPELEAEFIRVAVSDPVAGLIVAPTGPGTDLSVAIGRGVPVVCVDRDAPRFDVDTVVVDNLAGGRSATEELVRAGFRRIGCISGPEGVMTADLRVAGWRAAVPRPEPSRPPELLHRGPYTTRRGRPARAAALPELVDAVCRQRLAVGVVRDLVGRGSGPHEIGVVSLGELAARLYVPRGMIVTHLPARELGSRSAEMLIERIAGYDGPGRREVLPTVVTDDQETFTTTFPIMEEENQR